MLHRYSRWNETDSTKFRSDIDPDTGMPLKPRPPDSLYESLLSTVRKYVFFVTDKSVQSVDEYTDQGRCSKLAKRALSTICPNINGMSLCTS